MDAHLHNTLWHIENYVSIHRFDSLCCDPLSHTVCKERSIPRLVYTSTINVVFAGKPIVDGDEASVPYVPLDAVST